MSDLNGAQERLGRAVTVLRAERRIQRKALAVTSGVPYSFLTSIESGSRGMSHATLNAIAAAFGLQPSDLLRKADGLPTI